MTALPSKPIPTDLLPLIAMLFEVGAIQIEPRAGTEVGIGFRLAIHEQHPAAPLSPIYVNLRMKGHKDGRLEEEHVIRIARILEIVRTEMQLPRKPERICGIPDAGTPFGRALSTIRQIQHLELTKRMVDDERVFSFVDGAQPREGTPVLVVDDLISDAVVKRKILELIKSAGATPSLAVFLDRQQGGLEALAAEGYTVGAALTLTQLLDEGVRIHRMASPSRDLCLDYPRRLKAWKAARGIP